MTQSRMILAFVIVSSLLYSLWGCLCQMNVYDEGIIVYGAQRILSGDIIYKDFWTIYSPGQFWLVAILFKLFSSTLFVGRFLTVIINTLAAVTSYLVVRKFARVKFGLVSWLLVLFWINTYGFVSPAPTALLFVLVSCLFLARFFFEEKLFDLFLCGLFCGLVLLFRHDLGTFSLLGVILILMSHAFSLTTVKPVKVITVYLAGWSIIVIPCVTYLFITVPLKDLVYDLFIVPVFVYAPARWLAYPFIVPNLRQIFSGVVTVSEYFKQAVLRLDYYFPLVVYIAGLISIRGSIRKQARPFPVKVWIMGVFLVLGMLFYIQGFIRGHLSHLRPTFIPAIVILALLMEDLRRASPRFCAGCVMFIIFIAAMAWVPLSIKFEAVNAIRSNPFYFNIPRAKHIIWDKQGESYQGLVSYIQENVPENERIFVGNARHDRLFSSDVMLYFLCDRPSATRYHELIPGIVDTEPVQREIISDLERFKVRYIVTRGKETPELNQSGVSSGVSLLDDFIHKKFMFVKEFGFYAVWTRR